MGATTLINVAVKLFHDHAKFGGRGFLSFSLGYVVDRCRDLFHLLLGWCARNV
jgi:hypothetical protein